MLLVRPRLGRRSVRLLGILMCMGFMWLVRWARMFRFLVLNVLVLRLMGRRLILVRLVMLLRRVWILLLFRRMMGLPLLL